MDEGDVEPHSGRFRNGDPQAENGSQLHSRAAGCIFLSLEIVVEIPSDAYPVEVCRCLVGWRFYSDSLAL